MRPMARAWFNRYETWVEVQRPTEPYYYLGVIGTDMATQNQGYGFMLLERVQAMSEA